MTIKMRAPNWLAKTISRVFFPSADLTKCWITIGNTIYGPMPVPDDILQHEIIHMKQQAWGLLTIPFLVLYVTNKRFRYKMELAAYQAHFDYFRYRYPSKVRQYREAVAKNLSSAVYNNMVSYEQAYTDLRVET